MNKELIETFVRSLTPDEAVEAATIIDDTFGIETKMQKWEGAIYLPLTEQQSWFLDYLLDECLGGLYTKEIFKTSNEDEVMTFDEDFFEHIEEVSKTLTDLRGVGEIDEEQDI